MSDEAQKDPDRLEAEEQVFAYLKARRGGATLMGRAIDVSRDAGKREFAEWLVDILWDVNGWLDAEDAQRREEVRAIVATAEDERPEFELEDEAGRHHPRCVDPEGHPPYIGGACPVPDDK